MAAAAERTKMATIEKLMVQIFDHKSRILDLVMEQTRLFDHHLASKLLLDGIAPPPWLLHPDLPSRTSYVPKELNTEELISEVLLSRRRPVIPFSNSLCSLHEKPVAEATTGQLPNGLCTGEECAENKAFDEEDNSSALLWNFVSDAGCASVGVSTLDPCTTVPEDRREEDPSVTSPQDQRDTRVSDVNHDLALSLARLHRSRSRQRALELRNSAQVDKCRLEDETNLIGCSRGINGSAVPFLQVEQLEEMESVKTLDTGNVICAVEDDKVGDTWSKEQVSRNDSREVTRSRSPRLQESYMNVGSSSKVIREYGALVTDSAGLPIQQSNHGNQPLELVRKSPIAYQTGGETEPGVGEKRGIEKGSGTDFRRITRSKSFNQQSNCGTISLTRQAQLFDRGETIKSTNVIEESAGLKHVTDNYSGRITRSRNSRLPCNTVYDMSKPVRLSSGKENHELFVASGTGHSTKGNSGEGDTSRRKGSQSYCTIERVSISSHSNINLHISADKSLPIQEDQEPFAANSTDVSDEENIVDECIARNTRTEPLFTAERKSELVNPQDLACRVTRSRSAALHKPLETKLLNSSARIGRKVSGVDVMDLPHTNTSQPANLEGSAAIAKGNEIVPDGPVEAHPVCLGSNSGGVIEREVLSLCAADISMLVEPKQLNFDEIEASNFNGMSAPAVEEESAGRLSEKSPSALLESAGMLEKAVAENNQENDRISLVEGVEFGKEEEPQRDSSEVLADDTTTAIITFDQHVVSPIKEAAQVEMDIETNNLQQSDVNSNKRSSLIGNLVTIQAARESMPVNLLTEVTISDLSDVNAYSWMDLSLVTETETLIEAEPTELGSNDSGLETFSADQDLPKDADFPQVTKLDPCANQEVYKDHAVELPCAVSKDRSMGNLTRSTANLDMSQHHTIEPLERSIHEDTGIDCSQSTQDQIAAKSVAKTSFVGGSLSRNKRKRSDLHDTLSNSPGTKENIVLPVNEACEGRDSLTEEHSPRDNLESQDLQLSQEDVVQSVISRSQVEDLPQIEGQNIPEGSKSSPKLQVEAADFSLEERDRISNASFAFVNEELEASLVPIETGHAAGDCEGHLMEGTRDEGPASIIHDGEFQHGLEENGNSYRLKENIEMGGSEYLTYGEAPTQEEKFDLVGTSSLGSQHSPSLCLTGAHETMPMLERFIMQSDDEQSCSADEGISFDKLNLSNMAIERASILEQLCKSACMQTPVSFSSTSCKLHKLSSLHQSVPTGLLEGMDMEDKLPTSEEISRPSHARSHSDCLPGTTCYSDWDIKKPCTSPVRKVWDRIIKSGSSGKRRSLIPELPCINEENENGEEIAETYQEGVVMEMLTSSVNREPLAEMNANLPESEAASYADRFSLESVSTEFSFNGTNNKAKKNPGNGRSIQRRYNNKENEPLGATSLKGKPGSLHNRFSKPKFAKTSSRKGGQSMAETETKRSNIVSNITSFIPLVQQKQAPAIVTGKRDVKVKALEAAEAAKRAAEKKENERKLKKEAIKLKRARLEQENIRQLELQKKKKEEERKKKEAEMAAKKRQREEEEKKEKDRKRLRIDEARKQQQKEHEQKLQAAKEEKNAKGRDMGEKGHEVRESKDEKRNHKMEIGKADDNCPSISEVEPTTRASSSDDRRAGIVPKDFEASSNVGNSLKETSSLTYKVNDLDEQTRTKNSVATTSQEQSYDISPYKCSDDEDEEDDDKPNGKFIPSWASKNRIALAVFSQDRVDPAAIFPTESFCSIAEDSQRRFLGGVLVQIIGSGMPLNDSVMCMLLLLLPSFAAGSPRNSCVCHLRGPFDNILEMSKQLFRQWLLCRFLFLGRH